MMLARSVCFALWTLTACRPEPAAGRSRETVVALPAATAPTPNRLEAGPTVLDAGDVADAALALPRQSNPDVFACEAARCKAGSESCCVFSDTGVCIASVPTGPNDNVQVLAAQIDACNELKQKYSLTEIRRCDESTDCGKGEACCGTFMYGGASADVCVPIKDPKRSPCDFSELCVSSSTCRAPGAECIDGLCKKAVTLSCGNQRCTGAKSACCGDPPSCREPSGCESGTPRYRCTSSKDCLAGEHCQLQVLGSLCTNYVDTANSRRTCTTTRDCGGGDAFCKRYVCKDSEVPGIKACECP